MGDFSILYDLGKKFNFEVEQVDVKEANDVAISSTKIRKFLENGKVKAANGLLGYEYAINGKVVRGKAIGRDIGFPTANIEVADEYKLIAAVGKEGIYE